MAQHLPEHQDQYFLALQAAVHGAYKPRPSEPESDAKDEPDSKKTRAIRALDEHRRRATTAIQNYRARKAQGRL